MEAIALVETQVIPRHIQQFIGATSVQLKSSAEKICDNSNVKGETRSIWYMLCVSTKSTR